jgi:hypothetical protein
MRMRSIMVKWSGLWCDVERFVLVINLVFFYLMVFVHIYNIVYIKFKVLS